MRNLLMILLISLCSFSCSKRDVRKLLCDVDSYIIDRPDSALAVLDSIDRHKLTSRSLKAHHALLYSIALDKNYIDITDDSIARIAVDYYTGLKGNGKAKARSLYSLGRVNFNSNHYEDAILAYIQAEKYARQSDSLYLGLIAMAMRDVYNRTYNSVEEARCSSEAYQIFTSLNHTKYSRAAYYAMASSYNNLDEYDKAVRIYDDIINTSIEKDYIWASSVDGYVLSMLMSSNGDVDYQKLEDYMLAVSEVCPEAFTPSDYCKWAYIKYAIGDESGAELLMESLNGSQPSSASYYWQYRMATYKGDFEMANFYLQESSKIQSNEVEQVLRESLAATQRDYYQSQVRILESEVRERRMIALIVIMSTFVVILVFSVYVRKLKEDRKRVLESAENMFRQLENSKDTEYSQLKEMFISVYKSRFAILGKLCRQYYMSFDRTDHQELIYRKVSMMVEEVRNDKIRRKEFENVIDKELNGIMHNFRTEMTKIKEVDVTLFTYLITGFDSMTIAYLLNMDINNVYAHKRRLILKIRKENTPHMTQFLEMLNDNR